MAKWIVTSPDGKSEVEVEAETAEEAWNKGFPAFADKAREEFHSLPLGDKTLQSFDDAMRIMADSMSFGGADRLSSWAGGDDLEAERYKTQLARERMPGLLEFGYDLTGAAATAPFLPSAVRPVGNMIKSPAGRFAAKTALSAAEGGAIGAGEGVIRGEDPADWAKSGALGGVLGNTIGDAVSWGIRKYKGGGKHPTPEMSGARTKAGKARERASDVVQSIMDRAEVGTEGARSQYYDTTASEEINNILKDDRRMAALPPEIVEQLRNIRKGSLPVRASRAYNRWLHTPMGQSLTIGAVGGGGYFGQPILTAAGLGAFPAGWLAQAGANVSTKRGLEKVQRDIAKIPAPTEPAAGEQAGENIYKILRSLGL